MIKYKNGIDYSEMSELGIEDRERGIEHFRFFSDERLLSLANDSEWDGKYDTYKDVWRMCMKRYWVLGFLIAPILWKGVLEVNEEQFMIHALAEAAAEAEAAAAAEAEAAAEAAAEERGLL